MTVGIDGEAVNIYDVGHSAVAHTRDAEMNQLTGSLLDLVCKISYFVPPSAASQLHMLPLLNSAQGATKQGRREVYICGHGRPVSQSHSVQGHR